MPLAARQSRSPARSTARSRTVPASLSPENATGSSAGSGVGSSVDRCQTTPSSPRISGSCSQAILSYPTRSAGPFLRPPPVISRLRDSSALLASIVPLRPANALTMCDCQQASLLSTGPTQDRSPLLGDVPRQAARRYCGPGGELPEIDGGTASASGGMFLEPAERAELDRLRAEVLELRGHAGSVRAAGWGGVAR